MRATKSDPPAAKRRRDDEAKGGKKKAVPAAAVAHAERKAGQGAASAVTAAALPSLGELRGDIERFAALAHAHVPAMIADAVAASQLRLLNDAARSKFVAAVVDAALGALLGGEDDDEADEADDAGLSVDQVADLAREEVEELKICGAAGGEPRFAYDSDASEVVDVLQDGDDSSEEMEEGEEEDEQDEEEEGHLRVVTSLDELRDAGRGADGAELLVVLDAFAPWCGPCREIAPFVAELATRTPGASFVKANVDDSEALSEALRITGLPTFVLFRGGSEVARMVGASPAKLERLIKKHLSE